MKNLSSKVLLGASCFTLGIGVAFAAGKYLNRSPGHPVPAPALASAEDSTNPNAFPTLQSLRASMGQMDSMIDQFYKNAFGGRPVAFADPFQQMRNFQAQMMTDLGPEGGNEAGVAAIKKREDKQFVYYDIPVKDLKNEKLNVKVADGQINISEQVEQKSNGSNGMGSYFSSSFDQSFPAPPNVDADKMQMLRTPDAVTLKFPKVEAS